MAMYEYKVVPAPAKGEKTRGVKGPEGRFAHAIERLMNDMAAGGWEYQRAETLPSEERSGLTSSQTVWRNLLVFRRLRDAAILEDEGGNGVAEETKPAPVEDPEEEDEALEDEDSVASASTSGDKDDDMFRFTYPTGPDNGVEGATALDGPSSVLTDRAARLRQNSAAE